MRLTQTSKSSSSWDNTAPHDCPFATSTDITGLRRTGNYAAYTKADTWYPSWGKDDLLYTPFTDGTVFGTVSNSNEMDSGQPATAGHAVIAGDDPLDLQITGVGLHEGAAAPYHGRYPSASLHHDGTWYYGTYCLDDAGRGLNWDVLGPFVGFRTSTDRGANWKEGPHTPSDSIFGETAVSGEPVRMGAPHFVDFGRNMQHSPDGYAYLVGHGSRTPGANLSWISGDEITLARVRPTPETIHDPTQYEWAAGRNSDGTPRWAPTLKEAQPIASWPGHMGCATVTYLPVRRKYLMCVTDGWPTIKEMHSYVLEADELQGPWRMAAYMEEFGVQGYFLNIPSKFVNGDDSRGWLCYSANFTNHYLDTQWRPDPEGSRYAMCLQELILQP